MRRAEIEDLLPSVFQRTVRPGSPIAALLDGMEAFHAPIEQALDGIDLYFDPRRAPDRFVPFLAAWLDLARLLPLTTGLAPLRELVAEASSLACIRGTARGLIRTLEIATEARGFVVDEAVPGEDGSPRPFHVRIVAPRAAAVHRPLVERIIDAEKPAHLTYALEFADD